MTCAKNRVSLKVQVHPVVYDFYISRYGETFDVDDDDMIALILPHILQLRPKDYKPTYYAGYKCLDIVLHDFAFGHEGDASGKIIIENRNHLPDNHQYYISRFLDKIFKNIYHNYMLAYCRSNKEAIQKEGIYDFCMVYRIGQNKLNFDMLRKSWDRSNLKRDWRGLPPKQKIKRAKKNEK